MSIHTFFKSLTSTPTRRRPTRRSPPASRLCLEALEDRCLLSFSPAVSYPVGVNPQAVVTGDFNGDGRLDLAVANQSSNTVSILLGNADGTFQPAQNFATGANPRSLAVGDFNGDGKLDIVTANAGSNTVSVLLGNGDGTFQGAKNYAVGSNPVSVAVGNFDGKLDIVTANAGSNTVSLLPGNGDGTFGLAKSIASLGAPAWSVAVGDFNGDGKLDLAVATRGTDGSSGYYGYYPGNSPTVTVLLGNGNGTFTTGSSSTLPSPYFVPPSSYAPPSVSATDLNGDGKPDLVVTDAGDSAVSVLLNNGNGTFTGPTSFVIAGSDPASVAVADINGNGKLDIITANAGNNMVSVLPNIGNGTFGSPYTFTAGSSPASVATGDFNGDGRTDVAVANSGSNNLSVLLNNGYWPSLVVAATDPSTSAAISSTTAGRSFNLAVTADNPFGNVLTGYTDTVSFSSSDPQATIVNPATGLPVPLAGFTYTFTAADNGTHTFSVDLKTAGTHVIGVSDPSVGLVLTGPDITVNPGPFSTFVVGGFPSPTLAGQNGNFTVNPYDAYGNSAYNYTGTVIFSSSDSQATIIDPATGNPVALAGLTYTFSPYDYGTAYFDAALNTAGKSQSITATDSVSSKATGSQTGIEVDPAVTVSSPSAGYINQPLTFTFGTFGDPAGTVFTYKINWGDGSPVQTVTGPSGTQATHAFSTAGYSYQMVTATDPNGLTGTGGFKEVDTLPVTVAIQTDPAHTSQQMLVIKDSGNGDTVTLASAANNSVSLTVDGYNLGTIAPTNSNPFALVMALGTAGYETIDARALAVSSVLEGGGNNNVLYGGSARNLLIAGPGTATLYAGSAGDILIGGTTSYNSNLTALAYIMAEWDSTDSYTTRVNKISKGGGLNGAYVLNSTTVSDNNAADLLYGGAGLDWFFAHLKGKKNVDKIYGQTSGEVVTQI